MNRALRVCFAALLFAGILSSCGRDGSAAYEELRGVTDAFRAASRREADFQAETAFADPADGSGSILYSISGHASSDGAEPWAKQTYTATLLANTTKAEDEFRNNERIHTENGKTVVSQENTESVLRQFPFQAPGLPDRSSVASIEVSENRRGTLYTVTEPGTAERLDELCGWDWYTMSGINYPDRSRETFGPLVTRYTVSDGLLLSYSAECTFRIYAAAGYTPGYSDPEGNGLDLTVRLQWTYSYPE